MSDDLDLRGIDQRHEPDPEFRAALRRRVLDIAAGIDPSESTDPLEFATLDIEPVSRRAGPTRRRPLIRAVVAVAAAAAVVVATVVVISRDNGSSPSDTPMSVVSSNPLEEPSPDEVERASDAATYMVGSGHTEVTPARNYVSLRRCDPQVTDQPAGGCDGTQGWAYVTGGADSPEVHYGLLGIADYLTLSALDDRLFVASTPSSTSLRQSGPAAWLIDSVTGQRGPLKWAEQPVTLNSPEQALVLFPAHHPNPYYFPYNDFFEPFLPRVVDTRDWTIKPLSVPEDAAALPIAQPGSGRIWISTPRPLRQARAGLHRRRRRIVDRCRTSPNPQHRRGVFRRSHRGPPRRRRSDGTNAMRTPTTCSCPPTLVTTGRRSPSPCQRRKYGLASTRWSPSSSPTTD